MTKVEKYRQDAFRHLESSEILYKNEDWGRIPLSYARRWAQAFEAPEVDLNDLAEILRGIEQEQGSYDIGFHTFAVSMRNAYRELWEDYLKNRLEQESVESNEK